MFFKKQTVLFTFLLIIFLINNSYGQTNTPPTITATLNDQYYCPLSQINIVTDFNITDADNTPIDVVFIQISTGYIQSEDELKYLGTNPNITDFWNSSEGKLELSLSSASSNYSEIIAAVKNVVFESNNPNISNEKHFSFTIDEANYLPSTTHYYEYISDLGITWNNAKIAAQAKNYYGLQGYLATITTPEESQLIGEQATGAGWIGGSDNETEGVWKWVTGPEGLNGGTIFWNGSANGSSPINVYSNWNLGEPNNLGNEDYAHVISDPNVGSIGSWNDLINNYTNSDSYQPKGYVIEYGGMPGDPILNISASTNISIAKISSTTPNSTCGTGSVNLSATSSSGFVLWFNAPIGGSKLYEGDNFPTPNISNTTTYYVLASNDGSCENGIRIPIVATVNAIPTITSGPNVTICGVGTGTLTATASFGDINWYSSQTSQTSINTGNNYSPTITNTTTYYIDATENGCTSSTRTAVTLNVQKTLAPTGISQQTFCNTEYATIANLSITGTAILWYNAASGGTTLNNTNLLENNKTYYASQTINSCESPSRFAIDVNVFETPLPFEPTEISPLKICDSNLLGTDTDGFEISDLTQNQHNILNGQSLNDFDFNYFIDSDYLIPIANPTIFENTVSGGQTIYVRISNKLKNDCFKNTSFKIEINPLPIVTSIVELKQCDNDTDGISLFNLSEANILISSNSEAETFTYYLTESQAQTGLEANQITNFINYPNPTAINSSVFARIETVNGCFRTAKINLVVGVSQIPSSFQNLVYTICDNEDIDGDKRNGIASFDFSDAIQKIKDIFPLPHNFTVKFYNNEADALAEINPISDPSNHRNETSPNTQNIYVRIDSDDVNACLGLGHHITLNVEKLPIANPVVYNRQCDDFPLDSEITSEFDTSNLEISLLSGQSNVTVTYFSSNGNPLTDNNGNLIVSPFPNKFRTISQIITARVTNNSTNTTENIPCDDEILIEFIVDAVPVVKPIVMPHICDDGISDTDGLHDFDTSFIEDELLVGFKDEMSIFYTDSNGNPLPSPLPNPFTSGTQTIYVEIENILNPTCSTSTQIEFIVNLLPDFTVITPQIVCLNEPYKILTIETELEDSYSYDWEDENGKIITANSPFTKVFKGGMYIVTATSLEGCKRALNIEVNESVIATIKDEDIIIVDDSNNNTITILNENSNLGIGDYEFSLNDGYYQDEPFFDYVEAGIHTINIRDKNECGIAQKRVSVISFPKFFTPNNDSFNDKWQVIGLDKEFYPTSLIYIFDRFGKLITKIDPTGDGWDGYFNGRMLPSTDYWFTVQLTDKKGEIRLRKGHFSLIR